LGGHEVPHHVRPAVAGGDLEQGEHGGAQVAEPRVPGGLEQVAGHHPAHVEEQHQQAGQRDQAGDGLHQGRDDPAHAGDHRHQAQDSQDAQRADHGERAARREQRDADDQEVEAVPRVLEEPEALGVQARGQFRHEDAEGDVVHRREERAVRGDQRRGGLAAEGRGVHDDDHDDHPLEPLAFHEVANAVAQRHGSS
jgi:hypothetical protein